MLFRARSSRPATLRSTLRRLLATSTSAGSQERSPLLRIRCSFNELGQETRETRASSGSDLPGVAKWRPLDEFPTLPLDFTLQRGSFYVRIGRMSRILAQSIAKPESVAFLGASVAAGAQGKDTRRGSEGQGRFEEVATGRIVHWRGD